MLQPVCSCAITLWFISGAPGSDEAIRKRTGIFAASTLALIWSFSLESDHHLKLRFLTLQVGLGQKRLAKAPSHPAGSCAHTCFAAVYREGAFLTHKSLWESCSPGNHFASIWGRLGNGTIASFSWWPCHRLYQDGRSFTGAAWANQSLPWKQKRDLWHSDSPHLKGIYKKVLKQF